MEVDIQSKTDNPLLKRNEVYFTIHHEGEKTPKRELVRSELADKLNAKKENILIAYMKSSFGSKDTVGFAKVYKSVVDAKSSEKNHILKRNNIVKTEKKAADKKEDKTSGEKSEEKQIGGSEKPVDKPVEPAEKSSEEKPLKDDGKKESDKPDNVDEKAADEPKFEEKPVE